MSLVAHTDDVAFDLARYNARVFQRRDVVRYYDSQALTTAEVVTFLRHADALVGRRILDLGVGAGRTTHHLAAVASDYVGVDLSPAMLEIARRRFPGVSFVQADIRSVADLGLGAFDAVVASCNLLDALTHEDRLTTLAGIRRVLTAGGTLFLSAHNRDSGLASSRPRFALSRSPLRSGKNLARYALSLANYRRLAKHRVETRSHAILPDCAHDWRGLYYYIDARSQTAQLADTGYTTVAVYAEDGRRLQPGEIDTTSGSLSYVCRPS
jgi:SAM-dependent methyltransferase